jgi:hypothetical protein
MNTNTVGGFTLQGTTRNTWPNQAVAATAETILQINTDGTASNFFLTPPLPTTVAGAQTPFATAANAAITARGGSQYGLPSGWSNNGWNTNVLLPGRAFTVRLVGTGNAGANAAQSVIINLYQGTSSTVGSDKKIGTTGSALATVAGGAFNFMIEAFLLWDNTSQILSGSYTSNIAFGSASQFTTQTVVPNVVTAVTTAGLSFLGTITLGNAAASTVQVSEFVLEQS